MTRRSPAIVFDQVSKRFGRTLAVDRVSFVISAGEVVGLVGRNGAGKTTAMRMMSGFLDPDEGSVSVGGKNMMSERLAARQALGYMPEAVPLYRDMRVEEYLHHRGRLKGMSHAEANAAVADVCGRCGLAAEGKARQPIGQLSKGYRQRVGLADALLGDPPILLLDEPAAGLDPMQVRELRALIRALAPAHTVLVSSHSLSDIEAVATRILMLVGGKLAGNGTLDELRDRCGLGSESSLEDVFVALEAGGGAGTTGSTKAEP